MTVQIKNVAGETVSTADSDAEACRWYLDQGRQGDYLADTGELLSGLVIDLGLADSVSFDRSGCVRYEGGN